MNEISTENQNHYWSRLNEVIEYINHHLSDDLKIEKLADIACFSTFHFHRIFKAIIDESPYDYIHRLRLEKAAQIIIFNPSVKLSEVVFECGFNSLENFSRQFKRKYGFTARTLKKDESLRNSRIYQKTPEKSFYHVFEKSRQLPDYHFEAVVEERQALRVASVKGIFGEDGSGLVQAYHDLMDWANKNKYFNQQSVRIGLSRDYHEITNPSQFRYDHCLSVPTDAQGEGKVGIIEIAGGTYVGVKVQGDIYRVAQAWEYLYRMWLPKSKYQPRHLPALEIFLKGPEEIGWDQFDLKCCIPIELI